MRNGDDIDSALGLIEIIKRKAPEYLDLFTATTDADFDKAFDALLEQSVMHLEANKSNFEKLDEVALSAVLAARLSMPGLSVTQEAHSNGHVDLTIDADHCVPARRKLAEAKIWDGPEYHIQGIEQLLERYTTGREGRGLVIAYVKQKNISGLITKLRAKMDNDRPCMQMAATTAFTLKWSFLSTHGHSCGDSLDVCHVGCNLYTDPVPEVAG